MSESPTTNPKPMSVRVQVRVFMFSMLAYLLLVHVWGLGLPLPLIDNHYRGEWAWGYRHFFQIEQALFGEWVLGYQLMNLSLLYGCMVSLFFLTWHVLRGPIWMGSLAATLMMAHPMKTEAVLHVVGVQHLLPAFLSLVCLAFYMARGRREYFYSLLTFAMLSPFTEAQVGVFGVLAVLEWGIVPLLERRWQRLPSFALVAVLALFWNGGLEISGTPAKALVTLFLCAYPLGLLPETVQRLLEDTRFMSLAVWCGLVVAVLLGLAVRQRAYWVMLCAALLCAWLADLGSMNWVHFAGGGKTILVLSLVAIAFCAVVQHIFQEERWRKPMILLTSLLCVFFFGLQIREYARIRAEQNHETGKSWIQEMREWENGGGEQVK